MGSRVRQQRRRQFLALAAAAVPSLPLGALPQAAEAQTVRPYSTPGSGGSTTVVPVGGPLQLKVRRLPDAVEVVVEGVGETPQLQQSTRGPAWEGLLFTARPTSLRSGPQRIGLPEAGFASISLDGAGSGYRIQVTPLQGAAVPRPVVSADGRDLILSFAVPTNPQLQTMTPSVTTPGRVSDPSFVPPLQPRAVAPPVGDIAVGTMMLANPSYLNISGPPVTMTLRNAPAKDALMALSQMGGYGFVYVDEPGNSGSASAANAAAAVSRPLSIAFRNENYARALNSALLAAGLQGKREGNMILAGPNVLSKTFGSTMSKVFRLNQVSAGSAADYLANLGATVTKVNTITTAVTEGANQNNAIAGAPNAATTQSTTTTNVETYGASQGPLRGLLGTTDSRLETITLVGDPKVVAIAENYLRQLDLRQRQVALSVRILDVTLDNDTSIENSFAFRYGNNFIVNDRGELQGAFGSLLPPQPDGSIFDFNGIAAGLPPLRNPGQAYTRNNFYDLIRASIESRSTKVLASPTLILSDNPAILRSGNDQGIITQGLSSGGSDSSSSSSSAGSSDARIGRTRANEAYVTVGEQVITAYEATAGQNGAPTTCTPEFSVSGLTFGARVNKIDDNGFVTFSISPTISATTRTQEVPQCGPIDILSIRSLDSGSARVRDGQTLIMTGVISDLDSQLVKKWPILGDLPLVGQFFRDTQGQRRKRELVILVTPRILRDDQGGAFGYGYQPSTPQTRDFLRQAGS
ncbi:type II secretion system protein GspD [Synechococcus sp. CBW1004]|uniref:type II secretion system protein GspD n=1 Tax=Synechococcus sp. CBW1004 TaxID=1353136 RepID=UPI001E4C8940|nr:general secretion pathway protein D [Synechococcus sp. CBW1004]